MGGKGGMWIIRAWYLDGDGERPSIYPCREEGMGVSTWASWIKKAGVGLDGDHLSARRRNGIECGWSSAVRPWFQKQAGAV